MNLVNYIFNIPVKLLYFPRLVKKLEEFEINLGNIEIIPLMPYKNYLSTVYNSLFLISDSGTAQEEPAFLKTPVIVPRDFSERPESEKHFNSYRIDVNSVNETWENSIEYLKSDYFKFDTSWMSDGVSTSDKIINILKERL